MADLRGEQLKDSYQNVVTRGTGNKLENGNGVEFADLDDKASLSVSKNAVSVTKTDAYSESIATETIGSDVTGLIASITPSETTSKVEISGAITVSIDTDTLSIGIHLFRNGTEIGRADSSGSRKRTHTMGRQVASSQNVSLPFFFEDSPNTDVATSYSIRLSHNSGGTRTLYVNRSKDDSNALSFFRTASTITAKEIPA